MVSTLPIIVSKTNCVASSVLNNLCSYSVVDFEANLFQASILSGVKSSTVLVCWVKVLIVVSFISLPFSFELSDISS